MWKRNQTNDAVPVLGRKKFHEVGEKKSFSSTSHQFQSYKESGSPDTEHKDIFRVFVDDILFPACHNVIFLVPRETETIQHKEKEKEIN